MIQNRKTAKVMAVLNEKGGTGKTATSTALAYLLARKGEKVAILDFDGQGHSTMLCGVENPNKLEVTISTMLNKIITGEMLPEPESYIIQGKNGVDLIPSNSQLFMLERNLAGIDFREYKLSEYISTIKDRYSCIIIDCMPQIGTPMINVMMCADSIVIPTQAELLSAQGLAELMRHYQVIKRNSNHNLRIEGILVTMDTERTIVSAHVKKMEFSRMTPFPGHIFRLYEGQQLQDMVDSIKQFGILLPIILWQTGNDGHTILSGHNRVNAAQIAGLSKAPVVIKRDLSHDEAVLIVTETNLRQRSFSDLSHSERAHCLAQNYNAMKSQGIRRDLLKEIETLTNTHDKGIKSTSSDVRTKLRSDEKLGKDYGLSRDKVAKYIRLATLIPHLLAYLDTGEIAFLAAYDLTFIENKELQTIIAEKIKNSGYKVDMKIAALLRDCYEKKTLTETAIEQIMSGERTRKSKSDKPKSFQLKPAVVGKYFTNGQTKTEIEEIIVAALSQYFSNFSNQQNS
jgi:cellulose biosynthesis protein BcsQ